MNKPPTGRAIGISFAVSALASLGLMVTYILGGQVQVEGALIAIALGGMGVGLVAWGKDLMPGGHFVQEREAHSSSDEERVALLDDLAGGDDGIGRRKFLGRMLAFAAGSLGLAALFPIRSLGSAPGEDLFHTPWRDGMRLVSRNGLQLDLNSLETGGIITVYPQIEPGSADGQAVLIRVDPSELDLGERNDWTENGYVAYSKICTHAGCPVGLYQPETKELFCPCHQSVFDVVHGAEPVGGPATRPLPQLPISVDEEGYLIATGDFSDPVGPGFWNRDR